MSTSNQLKVQRLTLEAFQDFGTFAPLSPPAGAALVAGADISFWPDCGGVLGLGANGSNQVAIGICQVAWRPLQIDISEYHTATGEGNIPLDGDIYIHVGRPTTGATPPLDAMEIFLVPRGTAVVLKPGVWHHAPYATDPSSVVNTVILLPQRTYANDCVVCEINPPIPFIK